MKFPSYQSLVLLPPSFVQAHGTSNQGKGAGAAKGRVAEPATRESNKRVGRKEEAGGKDSPGVEEAKAALVGSFVPSPPPSFFFFFIFLPSFLPSLLLNLLSFLFALL
jgi:hypothetical protein